MSDDDEDNSERKILMIDIGDDSPTMGSRVNPMTSLAEEMDELELQEIDDRVEEMVGAMI